MADELEHQPGGRWEGVIAQGHSRVHNGHNYNYSYIKNQYVSDGPGAAGQPVDFVKALKFDHMDSRVASIESAFEDTGRWILDTPEYIRWRDATRLCSHHGFFWIKGKAGCGKSTVMKCALEYAEKTYGDNAVLSFFFHARGNTLEQTVEGMYRSLLLQLLKKFPDLHSTVPRYAPSDVALNGWRIALLRNYFSKSVLSLPKGTIVSVYIDALDECASNDIREAVEHFEELGKSANSMGIRLYICLASRYYPHITITESEELHLDKHRRHNESISKFVSSRLALYDPDLERDLTLRIQTRSSGIFLWVVLVVRILREKIHQGVPRRGLLAVLDSVPAKIQDLLADILQAPDKTLVATSQWVLFARLRLELGHIYSAIRVSIGDLDIATHDYSQTDRASMERFILHSSRGLVEVSQSTFQLSSVFDKPPTVQLIHESVREYLLCGGLAAIDPSLKYNMVPICHARLARWSQEYVELVWRIRASPLHTLRMDDSIVPDDSDWTQLEQVREVKEIVEEECPFLVYAIRHFFAHFKIAYGGKASCLTSLRDFPKRAWIRLRDIIELEERPHYYNSTTLVLLTLLSEAEELAKAILNASTAVLVSPKPTAIADNALFAYNPNQRCGGEFDTLIRVAIRKGYDGIALILLAHGADVRSTHRPLTDAVGSNNPDPKFVQALLAHGAHIHLHCTAYAATFLLHSATRRGLDAVVRVLLGAGANIEQADASGKRPLFRASEHGHSSTVRVLLEHGADLNATRITSGEGTALDIAASRSRVAVVKLLLDHRAKVGRDVQFHDVLLGGPRISTALAAACHDGRTDVVKLLLAHGADPECRIANGPNAIEIARQQGNKEILDIVQTAMTASLGAVIQQEGYPSSK